jgi:hypothetical protein
MPVLPQDGILSRERRKQRTAHRGACLHKWTPLLIITALSSISTRLKVPD